MRFCEAIYMHASFRCSYKFFKSYWIIHCTFISHRHWYSYTVAGIYKAFACLISFHYVRATLHPVEGILRSSDANMHGAKEKERLQCSGNDKGEAKQQKVIVVFAWLSSIPQYGHVLFAFFVRWMNGMYLRANCAYHANIRWRSTCICLSHYEYYNNVDDWFWYCIFIACNAATYSWRCVARCINIKTYLKFYVHIWQFSIRNLVQHIWKLVGGNM